MENNLFLKIKNRYGLIYLSVISIFIILDIIASAFITNFLYEPNTNPLNLFLILFIPSTSIFVGIITIIKFILEALKKRRFAYKIGYRYNCGFNYNSSEFHYKLYFFLYYKIEY